MSKDGDADDVVIGRQILIREEMWRALKQHCVEEGSNVTYKAGHIIEEWIKINLELAKNLEAKLRDLKERN